MPTASEAGTWITTVTLQNNTGGAVYDLEAFFSGVATSIRGEKLIQPKGGGTIAANVNSAEIIIKFDPALADAGMVQFSFINTASPDVEFNNGNWTDQNGKSIRAVNTTKDKVKVSTAAVPEPTH